VVLDPGGSSQRVYPPTHVQRLPVEASSVPSLNRESTGPPEEPPDAVGSGPAARVT
jgi:hypothetical protein